MPGRALWKWVLGMGQSGTERIEQLLSAGNLRGLIAELRLELRSKPDNGAMRTMLFDLLTVSAQIDDAQEQLALMFEREMLPEEAFELMDSLLDGERKRREFYEMGEGQPGSFGPPPQFGSNFASCVVAWASGQRRVVGETLSKTELPTVPGELVSDDGERIEFTDVRDCASLTGPFLPALVPGDFLWIPWSEIRALVVEVDAGAPLFWTVFQSVRLQWQGSDDPNEPEAWRRVWVPQLTTGGLKAEQWATGRSAGVMLEESAAGVELAFGWRTLKLVQENSESLLAFHRLREMKTKRTSP